MIGRGSSLTSVSARYEDMTFHNILLQNKVEALSSWVPEAEMTKDQTDYHLKKKKNCHETGKCADRWTINNYGKYKILGEIAKYGAKLGSA